MCGEIVMCGALVEDEKEILSPLYVMRPPSREKKNYKFNQYQGISINLLASVAGSSLPRRFGKRVMKEGWSACQSDVTSIEVIRSHTDPDPNL